MVRIAEMDDIPQLVNLVNAAYRGEPSRKGWTTEADLISGDLRIDNDSLEAMINEPSSIVLVFISDNKIAGCVYLEKQEEDLYLGLLSVWPELQGKDIGKKLLIAAEEYAVKNKKENIVMNVISRRQELISWYLRHGYVLTSETKPFPDDNRFGTPVENLEFVVLKKKLSYSSAI